MKKLAIIAFAFCAVLLLFSFASCVRTDFPGEASEDISCQLLENGARCNVISQEGSFWIELFDEKNDTQESLGPFSRAPKIEMVSPDVLKISYQAGTGNATRWNLYYSSSYGRLSEAYCNVLAESGALIVTGSIDAIIVQNAFDDGLFYRKFSVFKEDFSPVVNPFVCASFAGDCSYIEVTYLAGDDYHEVTEQFLLDDET